MLEGGVLVPLLPGPRIEIWREVISKRGIPPVRSLSVEENMVQDFRNSGAAFTRPAVARAPATHSYVACLSRLETPQNKPEEESKDI